MKKNIIALFLLVTITTCIGCTYNNNNLNNDEWIEDIDFLNTEIIKRHPDPFIFNSQQNWNENINKIKLSVNNCSDLQISMQLLQLISSIRDMHTYIPIIDVVTPPGEEKKIETLKVFPFKYCWFNDGLRVVACDKKYQETLGLKLKSINNIEVDDIISKIVNSFPHENKQGNIQKAKEYLSIYEILNFINIVNSETTDFVFQKSNGESLNLSIQALNQKYINFITLQSIIKENIKITERPNGAFEEYWFKYIEDDNLLYFQYNQCVNKTSSWVPNEEKRDEYPDFYKFVDDLILEINNTDFDKFIIDLSNNNGGTLGLTNYLITKLNSQTNIKQKSKIYVISGGNTLSAGVHSIVDFVNNLDAIVVGEETGSNVNMTNVTYNTFQLPNSKINVNCGSNFINKVPEYNGGYKPDIEIKQNYNNYINGIYDCYEYIKLDK